MVDANSDKSSSSSIFQCDNSPKKVPVSLTDRKSHVEGLICAFIGENDFLLSSAPKLLEFAKEMATDSKALNDSIGKITVSVSHQLKYQCFIYVEFSTHVMLAYTVKKFRKFCQSKVASLQVKVKKTFRMCALWERKSHIVYLDFKIMGELIAEKV